jgi:choline dehydrogenase-like flavoprotein
MSDHYDVIVIGSGAGGGTLTHALAPTGKKILLLERGHWYPRERDNWSSQVVWGELRYRNAGLWTDQNGRQFNPKQTTTSAATPRSTARCCSAGASATSGACTTSTASHPRGR